MTFLGGTFGSDLSRVSKATYLLMVRVFTIDVTVLDVIMGAFIVADSRGDQRVS